jgi:hypothetical protein
MSHNWAMRNRRFLLLAAVLVTLNATLWLVPQGLATTSSLISSLFGKNMVRAQILETSGITYHVDRGIVVANVTGLLTLQEADGATQPIVTSASTKVIGAGKLKSVKTGWHVLVTWPDPNGPAEVVQVEKKHL